MKEERKQKAANLAERRIRMNKILGSSVPTYYFLCKKKIIQYQVLGM